MPQVLPALTAYPKPLRMSKMLKPGIWVFKASTEYWRMARTGAQTAESERTYRAGLDLLRQRTFTSVRQGTAELRRAVFI